MRSDGEPGLPWGILARGAVLVLGLPLLGFLLLQAREGASGWDLFGENGRFEIAQDVLLAIGLLLAVETAWRRPASRPLSVLLAGLLLVFLVREQNNVLAEHVMRGLMWPLVALIGLITLLLARPTWSRLGASVRALAASPAAGWLAAAAAVLLLGQLFDERSLWDVIVGPGHPYAARRMPEETLELAAWWLLLAGIVEYRLAFRRPEGSP